MEQDGMSGGCQIPPSYLQSFEDSLSSGSTDSPHGAVGSPLPPLPPGEPKPLPKIQTSQKGVENAKKRLRAFSIQMRTPATTSGVQPTVNKSPSASKVIIGKFSMNKVMTPKFAPKVFPKPQPKPPVIPIPYELDEKVLVKPPKPGSCDNYWDQSKKTLTEIEDMKRKMELVDLGIPLGLICPESNPASKAMPTKAMPPIKSFLNATPIKPKTPRVSPKPRKPSEQLDEIISEAKKARTEGREFKFDYQKLLPNYENPFQRKKDKDDDSKKDKYDKYKSSSDKDSRSDKYESRRHSSHKRDERDKSRTRDKERSKDRRDRDKSREQDHKNRERDAKSKEADAKKKDESSRKTKEHNKPDGKESKFNLNDYLICDSWSENDSKPDSPITALKTDEVKQEAKTKVDEVTSTVDPMDQLRESLSKRKQLIEDQLLTYPRSPLNAAPTSSANVPLPKAPPADAEKKIEKLQPVMDSFTYEIDEDDDAALDIFDEDIEIGKFAEPTKSEDSQDSQMDDNMSEDFLESVINEIKDGDMSDDNLSQDKGLVEYDSPDKDTSYSGTPERNGSITPELSISGSSSRRSDYSESGFRSIESYKSSESGYRSTKSDSGSIRSDQFGLSDVDDLSVDKIRMNKATEEYLETWSFVLKICQPLLFRHDKPKCYRQTKAIPKLWYAHNSKLCDCVKDRSVVYEELERCKMMLVDRVYGCDQMFDAPPLPARTWYPAEFSIETQTRGPSPDDDWESEEHTVKKSVADDLTLSMEYKKFMSSLLAAESKRSPKGKSKKKMKKSIITEEKKPKKIKMDDCWSQDDEIEDSSKSTKKQREKIEKTEKGSKKRKLSSSSPSESSGDGDVNKKRRTKSKKEEKRMKVRAAKRRKLEKKQLRKLKVKQKKKAKKKERLLEKNADESNDEEDLEIIEKPKKMKKKKQSKLKKKEQRKKKPKSSSSSSDTDSSSDSETTDSDSARDKKLKKKRKSNESRKKKNKKKRKRKQSTSESTQSDEVFDADILKNIKTEKGLEDEIAKKKLAELQDFSPRRQPESPKQEIINMRELQNEIVTKNLEIKKESDMEHYRVEQGYLNDTPEKMDLTSNDFEDNSDERKDRERTPEPPQHNQIKTILSEESLSQNSSQDSTTSLREAYEKDMSHLRPSSQNSNYSFNDVINSKVSYESANNEVSSYDMYEQIAMEYQCGVAKEKACSPQPSQGSQPIETVVSRGQIKYEWRPGDPCHVEATSTRPSRWGLKPGEANIVLTGNQTEVPSSASEEHVYPIRSVLENDTYPIESINNRTDSISYDEAYEDMYGESDRLQYGDCFGVSSILDIRGSLDDRISQVLAEVAKEESNLDEDDDDDDVDPDGKLELSRGSKCVRFADGYKPGQDSDIEEPPLHNNYCKGPRYGTAWPCPIDHPDHVPLWDALPPPPPPPGSPPPYLPQPYMENGDISTMGINIMHHTIAIPHNIPQNMNGMQHNMHCVPQNMVMTQNMGVMPQNMVMAQSMGGMPQNMVGLPQNMTGMPQNMVSMPQSMPMMNGMPQNMAGMPQHMNGMPQNMNNMQQNMNNMPQNMVGMPQNMGNMPQNMGNMPQNMGNMPQNMGNMTQNMGNMQQNMVNMPQHMGNMPQNMGNMPQHMGNMPQNMVSMPQNMVNMPQNMGNIPQNMGMPPGMQDMNMPNMGMMQMGNMPPMGNMEMMNMANMNMNMANVPMSSMPNMNNMANMHKFEPTPMAMMPADPPPGMMQLPPM